jgi:hypothetical protein
MAAAAQEERGEAEGKGGNEARMPRSIATAAVHAAAAVIPSAVSNFAAAPAGTLGAAAANWMGLLCAASPSFGHRTLSQLYLPGSHDSGCYRFDPFTTPWAKTQSEPIGAQLRRGIRYLDLRFRHLPTGSKDSSCSKSVFQVYHNKIPTRPAVTLDMILAEIREFLEQHKGELVVIEFAHLHHFKPASEKAARHPSEPRELLAHEWPATREFWRRIRSAIGPFLATKSAPHLPRIAAMLSSGQRVMISVDNPTLVGAEEAEFVWPPIPSCWRWDLWVKHDLKIMKAYLESNISRIPEHGGFRLQSAGTTPSALDNTRCEEINMQRELEVHSASAPPEKVSSSESPPVLPAEAGISGPIGKALAAAALSAAPVEFSPSPLPYLTCIPLTFTPLFSFPYRSVSYVSNLINTASVSSWLRESHWRTRPAILQMDFPTDKHIDIIVHINCALAAHAHGENDQRTEQIWNQVLQGRRKTHQKGETNEHQEAKQEQSAAVS